MSQRARSIPMLVKAVATIDDVVAFDGLPLGISAELKACSIELARIINKLNGLGK